MLNLVNSCPQASNMHWTSLRLSLWLSFRPRSSKGQLFRGFLHKNHQNTRDSGILTWEKVQLVPIEYDKRIHFLKKTQFVVVRYDTPRALETSKSPLKGNFFLKKWQKNVFWDDFMRFRLVSSLVFTQTLEKVIIFIKKLEKNSIL